MYHCQNYNLHRHGIACKSSWRCRWRCRRGRWGGPTSPTSTVCPAPFCSKVVFTIIVQKEKSSKLVSSRPFFYLLSPLCSFLLLAVCLFITIMLPPFIIPRGPPVILCFVVVQFFQYIWPIVCCGHVSAFSIALN